MRPYLNRTTTRPETRGNPRSGEHPPTCQGDGDVRINTKKQPPPPAKPSHALVLVPMEAHLGKAPYLPAKPNRLTQRAPYHAYHSYHAPFPSAAGHLWRRGKTGVGPVGKS
jgi:hypothetical protein